MSLLNACRVLRKLMHEMVPGSQVIWYTPWLICMHNCALDTCPALPCIINHTQSTVTSPAAPYTYDITVMCQVSLGMRWPTVMVVLETCVTQLNEPGRVHQWNSFTT